MPAKKKRGKKGSRSPSPNTNSPKKAKSSSQDSSEGQGYSSNVKTEEDTPTTASGPELPAVAVPTITSTPPTPIEIASPLWAEKVEQERKAKEGSLEVPSTPPPAVITLGEGPAAQELVSPSSSTDSGTVVTINPEDPFALDADETPGGPDPNEQIIVSPSPSISPGLQSPSSSTASGPEVILNSGPQNAQDPNNLSTSSPTASPSSNDPLNAAIVGVAEAFNTPTTPEPRRTGYSSSAISPPRFANGTLLNSPGAKVPGLSLGSVSAPPSTGNNNASDGNEPPKGPTQTSDPSNVVPPVTPAAKEPPTPSTTSQIPSVVFSTPATQTTASHATTPSPSRLPPPPPPFNLESPVPATTPAAPAASGDGSQQSGASGSQTPPPGRTHIYFYNDGDHAESARNYPEVTDNADRAATMGMHAENDGPLRSYRSPDPPTPEAPSDPNSGSKIRGTTKAREITEFQEYAEGKEGECVALGTKALDAALKMSRERMIEHLTLVNANRELSELSNRLTEQLKAAMKEAKKHRGEGTITQHELEAAMQDERDAKNKYEARLEGQTDEMHRLEAVEKEYQNAIYKIHNLADENSSLKREVAKLKGEAEKKDEEIRNLKEEKGDMISKEDCDKLNATKIQELQDKLAGLEKDLADTQPPRSQEDEINASINRFSDWIASLGTQNATAIDPQNGSENVVSAETETLFKALLEKLRFLIAGPPKDGDELNSELRKMSEQIFDLESQLTCATDIDSETGSEFSAGKYMKKEEDLKELKEQLRALDVSTPTGKRLEEELNTKLDYIRLLESGVPTGFNPGEEATFKDCNEECIAEKEGLLNENQKLYGQLNDADEALRSCRTNNPQLFQNMDTLVSIHEQVQELCAQLARSVVDNKTMSEIFMKNELHKQGTPSYNELEAKSRDLQCKIDDLETQLLDVGVVNSQLNDDIEKLQDQLKKRPNSQAAAPQLPQEQQVPPTALDREIATLKASQTTLREMNQQLRNEVEPLKRKLKSTEDERTVLKDALRADNEDVKKLEKQVIQMDKDLDDCKKHHKVESQVNPTDSKKIKILEKKVRELEKKLVACKKSAEGESKISEAGKAALEQTIQDLETKLEESEQECVDAKTALGAKIKEFALAEAKAERQRQVERMANKAAQPNQNSDADASPGSDRASSSGAREEVEVSLNAMDLVFIRVELQLGQLQAGRSRWGFRDDDAAHAISVAIEAQSMAERLYDPNLIGRANYWRGVAEFMAGNSAAAEQWFEESTGQPWTESEDERELLEEWWDVSKSETVDKTVQYNPLEASPEMPRAPLRTLSTKPKRSAEERAAIRQAKVDKKQARGDKKQAKRDKNQAKKDKKKKADATQTQPPAGTTPVPEAQSVQPVEPEQPLPGDAAQKQTEPEEVPSWSKSCTSQ